MGCIKKVVVVERLDIASVEDWTGLFRRKTLEIIRLDGRIASAAADLARIGQAGTLHSLSRFHACPRILIAEDSTCAHL